jgi:tetratricopeptide (TPR) repeat protein
MGDTAGAERSLAKAIAIRERLAAQTDDDEDRAALADVLLDAARERSMEPAALDQAQRALALRAALAAARPDDVKRKRGHATALLDVGDLIAQRGDYAQGIVYKRRAYEMFEALAIANPGSNTDLRNAALGAKYLGALLQKTRDRDGARTLYERAVALDGMRVAMRPHDAGAKLDLSYSEASLANLLGGDGDTAAALAGYGRALALRQQIADADPLNRTAQARVARAHWAIAGVHGQTGDLAGEIAATVRAVVIYEALLAIDPLDVGLAANLAEATNDLAYSTLKQAIAARARGADPRPHLDAARAWSARAVGLLEKWRPRLNTRQLETLVLAVSTRALGELLREGYAR